MAGPTDAPGFLGTARYRVHRTLGEGGMGVVYEVEDRERGGHCALKVMRGVPSGQSLLRFKREFRAVCDLVHPNLVRMHELAGAGDTWFYTMELIHGVDLLRAVCPDDAEAGRARCDFPSLDGLMPQLLDALAFLHDRGLVHRDLKPGNVMVDDQGRLKLVDFGIVKLLTLPAHTAGLMGTLAYMSPEQCVDGDVGPASDLYALGCMLYQIVTGATPFDASSLKVVMDHQLTTPALVSDKVSGVPERYTALIRDLLAKDPGDRPTIAEIRARLQLADLAATTDERPPPRGELFVGRASEREALEDLLEEVAGGAIRGAFVGGDRGLGKSWLARHVAQRAVERGFQVFRGRCYEREQLPFRALDQLMDELALTLRGRASVENQYLAPAIVAVRRLFPTFAAIELDERSLEAPAEPTPREQLQLAMLGLERVLGALSEERPLMLVIDDLQWTDAGSLQLLEQLLQSRARLLVLGLHRPEGGREGHPLEAFLDRYASEAHVLRLELGPMSEPEVATLLQSHSVGGLDRSGAAELARQIAGNPFVAAQVGTLLRKRRVRRRLSLADVSVSELVRLRFEQLSAPAQALIEIVACAGGALDRELLAAASDQAELEQLDHLLAERILRVERRSEAPGEAAVYDFYHDTFRETAYSGLDGPRRRALHARLARAYEALRPSASEALLRHWSEAADDERAARYLRAAAEEAADKLAFGRAAELLTQHLSTLDLARQEERVALLERLGTLRELAGDLEGALSARSEALELLRWLGADGDRHLTRRRLQRLEVENLIHLRRFAEGRARLQALLAEYGHRFERSNAAHWASILWMQARLSLWSLLPNSWGRRRPDPAWEERLAVYEMMSSVVITSWPLAASECALRYNFAIRRAERDGGVRSACLQMIQGVLIRCPSPRGVDKLLARLERLESDAGEDPKLVSLVHYVRGGVLLHREPAAAYRCLISAMEILESNGLAASYEAVMARSIAMWAAEHAGSYDEALRHCLRLDRLPTSLSTLASEPLRVRIHLMRGQLDQAQQVVSRWASALSDDVETTEHFWVRLLGVHVALARGEVDEATLARLAEIKAFGRDNGDLLAALGTSHWLDLSVRARLVLLARGRLPAAQLRRGKRFAKKLARRGWTVMRSAGHWGLSAFARAEGRADEAEREAALALESARRTGGPWYEWLALRLQDEGGERARALQEAHGFAETGLTALPGPSNGPRRGLRTV